MRNVGYLKPITNSEFPELHGEIKTLEFKQQVNFMPVSNKSSDKAPDYQIVTADDVHVGGAWKQEKPSQNGEPPFKFLSISIDDPSMRQPLNVHAYPQENGTYEVQWRRRQSAAKDAA